MGNALAHYADGVDIVLVGGILVATALVRKGDDGHWKPAQSPAGVSPARLQYGKDL